MNQRVRQGSLVALALVALAGSAGCTPKPQGEQGAPSSGTAPATLTVESTAFGPNGAIPSKYTCEGQDLAPPLAWSGVPERTQSLALIVDDPDAPDPKAPKRTWVHWVVYDLPPTSASLPEAASELPAGARGGHNDWKRTGYGGPCPPIGRHRYFHKLYALDKVLGDLGTPTKADLERAMQGHILAQGELIGTYEKTGTQEPPATPSTDATDATAAPAPSGADGGA